MQSLFRQFDKRVNAQAWPILTGPIVVFVVEKNVLKKSGKITAGFASVYSRDGPLIFHMRDRPPNVTGLPGGTGPPQNTNILATGSAPPKTTDPPLEWLVRKKILKKF